MTHAVQIKVDCLSILQKKLPVQLYRHIVDKPFLDKSAYDCALDFLSYFISEYSSQRSFACVTTLAVLR